jgi:formate/nitrite transporter FocA (FNT family)
MENNNKFPNKEELTLSSKKKWLWLGVIIALVNPIFSGLIIGLAFWTEPRLKKEAKTILAISIVWGLIIIYLSRWLIEQGFLPVY